MQDHPFETFGLNHAILRAVTEEGYERPTEIQFAAIPQVLAGKDLMATAQTGTGKTAAFALPMLHKLHRRQGSRRRPRGPHGIRALILTPTRELALQVDDSLCAYGRHLRTRTAVLLGGVSSRGQVKALRQNPDIVVATPGRLLDLMGQGHVRLGSVEILVLDEADRMLDMGFVRDVRKIVRTLPRERQTLFFSATLSPAIADLASDMLRDPVSVEVAPPATVAENIDQKVYFVDDRHKKQLLIEMLEDESIERTLIFTATRARADQVLRQLTLAGVAAETIHSDKDQRSRQTALAAFDEGHVRVLVATDIVARGIDVEGITHVINYEMPTNPESYVHRIGRTARAGAEGVALSFCDGGEVSMLKRIEKLVGRELTLVGDHPYHSTFVAALCNRNTAPPRPTLHGGRRGRSRSRGRRYV